jgi:hypothetical protein
VCRPNILKRWYKPEEFQITRIVHKYSTHEVYTCTLNLIAARSRAGAYKPKVTPFLEYLGMSLAVRMRRPMGDCTRRFTEKVDIKKIEENSI